MTIELVTLITMSKCHYSDKSSNNENNVRQNKLQYLLLLLLLLFNADWSYICTGEGV